MQLLWSGIPGCAEVRVPHHPDARGSLTKYFQASAWRAAGVDLRVDEVFVSRSARGVLRGLHFQLPPHPVVKVVWCAEGTILDVVVDVRTDSPTFGEHRVFSLAGDVDRAVVVPVGCAHGFLVTSEQAVVGYLQQGELDPGCDAGIHWASAGIEWPIDDPVVSARDAALPPLERFSSPFRLGA